ncbi:transglutaminase-like domain-containing protein [Sulfurospirillum arcachonense]|uniref:transglutaminase-like domain-containing protein n=1 Tax=Sulfurospirillum arcachonense TaxID=57666 RepID=UPI0004684460|nr:transglutaminase-like domain-containing protein [Sulfurospirillum arcachonense]
MIKNKFSYIIILICLLVIYYSNSTEKPRKITKPKAIEKPKKVSRPKIIEKPKKVNKSKTIEKPRKINKPTIVEKIPKIYDLKIPKKGKAQELTTMKYARITPTKGSQKYGYYMSLRKKFIFASVKPSTLNKMYFVNGYLNGFVPYKVDNIWKILQYIQTRLKYQLDEVGYNHRKEVWQTSKESYIKLRGDCEDHAILLADWLIGLGYDARVVAGTVKQRGKKPAGHAWVVLFKDGKEYLLESTKKSKWNSIPYASTLPYYYPKYMFNRKQFWINTGSIFTTKYSGNNWKNSGKFIPYDQYYKDLDS